jgi:hypothetical protein
MANREDDDGERLPSFGGLLIALTAIAIAYCMTYGFPLGASY